MARRLDPMSGDVRSSEKRSGDGAQAPPVPTAARCTMMPWSTHCCFAATYHLTRSMTALVLVGDEVNKRHFVCEDELNTVAHYGGEFVSEDCDL